MKNHPQDLPENKETSQGTGTTTRRGFLARVTVAGASLTVAPLLSKAEKILPVTEVAEVATSAVNFSVNGKKKTLNIDNRLTLLDALRETLSLTGTKKGCDHGQCGACTVLVNGTRINSCLTLAAVCEGAEIITIEGLGSPEHLHPLQEAFIRHDAFQCGYCTPGQICSAAGLIREGHAHTDDEIRES